MFFSYHLDITSYLIKFLNAGEITSTILTQKSCLDVVQIKKRVICSQLSKYYVTKFRETTKIITKWIFYDARYFKVRHFNQLFLDFERIQTIHDCLAISDKVNLERQIDTIMKQFIERIEPKFIDHKYVRKLIRKFKKSNIKTDCLNNLCDT